MSLNVYLVWYNYFDFHFHWSARDISYFFSAFGLTVAATSGLGISFLVPQRLSEEQGFLLGLLLQVWVGCFRILWIMARSCARNEVLCTVYVVLFFSVV